MKKDFLLKALEIMPPHRALIRACEAHFYQDLKPKHPILDIGCGDGTFAQLALQKFAPIEVGLDPDPRELKFTQKTGLYQKLIKGSATHLPFEKNFFGTVISNCTLEHIPNLDQALAEICRVLKPGGIFVLTVPNINFNHWLFGTALFGQTYTRFLNWKAHHYHIYNQAGWTERFQKAGFEVLETKSYFSSRVLKVFDFLHYLSLPSLAFRFFLNRWVIFPALTSQLVRLFLQNLRVDAHHETRLDINQGAYLFFLCKKRSSRSF